MPNNTSCLCSWGRSPREENTRLHLHQTDLISCYLEETALPAIVNCPSPGYHYISYHPKKVGWFQVEWQALLELDLLALSSAPFQDGSNRKQIPNIHRLIASLWLSHMDHCLFCSTLSHNRHIFSEISGNFKLSSDEESCTLQPWISTTEQ